MFIDPCKTHALDTEQELADDHMHTHIPRFMPDSNWNPFPIQHHQHPAQQSFQGVNDSDSTHYKLEGVHSAVIASKVSSASSLPKPWTWRPGFLWHKGEK